MISQRALRPFDRSFFLIICCACTLLSAQGESTFPITLASSVLQIDGVPVGKELGKYYLKEETGKGSADGSCMIVVAMDAPLDARNLKRLAGRCMLGLARTGGIATHGSGDYVIAFSVHPDVRIKSGGKDPVVCSVLPNDAMSPLFGATIEATEDAIYHSSFAAQPIPGRQGHIVPVLPVEEVLVIMKRCGR